jgi:hypothetical protein
MKKREKSDQQNGRTNSEVNSPGYQHAEHSHRQQNCQLNTRHDNSRNPDDSAEGHHADESQRNQPNGTATLLGCPQPHGNHHHKVIPAMQGMIETVMPPIHRSASRVCVSLQRKQHQSGQQ